MRKIALVTVALALAACQGGDGETGQAGGGQAEAAGQQQQQAALQQARQEAEELQEDVRTKDRRIGELESRVSTLEDSVSSLRTVPNRLVSGGRFGCVDWARDASYLVCTHQTLASKP